MSKTPGPREQIADAMSVCHEVYNENPGLLLIGSVKFWWLIRLLDHGESKDVDPMSATIRGLPVLILSMYPDLLLAVPESKADEVRQRLIAVGKLNRAKK